MGERLENYGYSVAMEFMDLYSVDVPALGNFYEENVAYYVTGKIIC